MNTKELLIKTEKILDNNNYLYGDKDKLCLLCDTNTYDGVQGIKHESDCIIIQLRELIKMYNQDNMYNIDKTFPCYIVTYDGKNFMGYVETEYIDKLKILIHDKKKKKSYYYFVSKCDIKAIKTYYEGLNYWEVLKQTI